MIGISIVFAAIAAAHPLSVAADFDSDKTLNGFGACFASSQEQAGRAWSFVPSADGGRFSNLGASGDHYPYELRFTEYSSRNRIQLLAGDNPDRSRLIEAVDRCR